MQKLSFKDRRRVRHATQRANIVEKFHKPPHGVNVRNFRNKSHSIFMLHKIDRNKKCAPKLIFSDEIFL